MHLSYLLWVFLAVLYPGPDFLDASSSSSNIHKQNPATKQRRNFPSHSTSVAEDVRKYSQPAGSGFMNMLVSPLTYIRSVFRDYPNNLESLIGNTDNSQKSLRYLRNLNSQLSKKTGYSGPITAKISSHKRNEPEKQITKLRLPKKRLSHLIPKSSYQKSKSKTKNVKTFYSNRNFFDSTPIERLTYSEAHRKSNKKHPSISQKSNFNRNVKEILAYRDLLSPPSKRASTYKPKNYRTFKEKLDDSEATSRDDDSIFVDSTERFGNKSLNALIDVYGTLSVSEPEIIMGHPVDPPTPPTKVKYLQRKGKSSTFRKSDKMNSLARDNKFGPKVGKMKKSSKKQELAHKSQIQNELMKHEIHIFPEQEHVIKIHHHMTPQNKSKQEIVSNHTESKIEARDNEMELEEPIVINQRFPTFNQVNKKFPSFQQIHQVSNLQRNIFSVSQPEQLFHTVKVKEITPSSESRHQPVTQNFVSGRQTVTGDFLPIVNSIPGPPIVTHTREHKSLLPLAREIPIEENEIDHEGHNFLPEKIKTLQFPFKNVSLEDKDPFPRSIPQNQNTPVAAPLFANKPVKPGDIFYLPEHLRHQAPFRENEAVLINQQANMLKKSKNLFDNPQTFNHQFSKPLFSNQISPNQNLFKNQNLFSNTLQTHANLIENPQSTSGPQSFHNLNQPHAQNIQQTPQLFNNHQVFKNEAPNNNLQLSNLFVDQQNVRIPNPPLFTNDHVQSILDFQKNPNFFPQPNLATTHHNNQPVQNIQSTPTPQNVPVNSINNQNFHHQNILQNVNNELNQNFQPPQGFTINPAISNQNNIPNNNFNAISFQNPNVSLNLIPTHENVHSPGSVPHQQFPQFPENIRQLHNQQTETPFITPATNPVIQDSVRPFQGKNLFGPGNQLQEGERFLRNSSPTPLFRNNITGLRLNTIENDQTVQVTSHGTRTTLPPRGLTRLPTPPTRNITPTYIFYPPGSFESTDPAVNGGNFQPLTIDIDQFNIITAQPITKPVRRPITQTPFRSSSRRPAIRQTPPSTKPQLHVVVANQFTTSNKDSFQPPKNTYNGANKNQKYSKNLSKPRLFPQSREVESNVSPPVSGSRPDCGDEWRPMIDPGYRTQRPNTRTRSALTAGTSAYRSANISPPKFSYLFNDPLNHNQIVAGEHSIIVPDSPEDLEPVVDFLTANRNLNSISDDSAFFRGTKPKSHFKFSVAKQGSSENPYIVTTDTPFTPRPVSVSSESPFTSLVSNTLRTDSALIVDAVTYRPSSKEAVISKYLLNTIKENRKKKQTTDRSGKGKHQTHRNSLKSPQKVLTAVFFV